MQTTDPTITIVNLEHLYAVIISQPPPTDNPTLQLQPKEGVLAYSLSFDAAIDEALAYLATPSASSLLVTFKPPAPPRRSAQRIIHTALTPIVADQGDPLNKALELTNPATFRPNFQHLTTAISGKYKVRLSNDAWERIQDETRRYRYDGRGPMHGCTYFLLALMIANPTPQHWVDTRPPQLKQYDQFRLKHNRFPYWSEAQDVGLTMEHTRRLQRSLNANHIAQMFTLLMPIADHFLIAPYAGDQTTPITRALTVLECYGLKYLTPIVQPPMNPTPAREDKRRWRATRLRNRGPELVF